jgi:Mn2+/Fe2+ NRAMP family transporter
MNSPEPINIGVSHEIGHYADAIRVPAGYEQPAAYPRAAAPLCPDFVAAVVYIDPGNSATTVVAGAGYGYSLASVIVAANLMALLVQFAKVGVATELNMPELCRKHVPRPAA